MTRFLGGEKDGQLRHVFRRADPPQWHLAPGRLELLLGHPVARLRGIGEPGSDGVHAYLVGSELERGGAGHAHDPRLARHVMHAAR